MTEKMEQDVGTVGQLFMADKLDDIPCNLKEYLADLHKTIMQMQVEINSLKAEVYQIE